MPACCLLPCPAFRPSLTASIACCAPPFHSPQYAYVIHTTNPTNGDAGEIYCELVGAAA